MKAKHIIILSLSSVLLLSNAAFCMKKLTPREKIKFDLDSLNLKRELRDLSDKITQGKSISEETKKSVITKFDNLKAHMDPGSINYVQELIDIINQQPQPQPVPEKKKAPEKPKVTAREAKDLIDFKNDIINYIELFKDPNFDKDFIYLQIENIGTMRKKYNEILQKNENKIKERKKHFEEYLSELNKLEKELQQTDAYKEYKKNKASKPQDPQPGPKPGPIPGPQPVSEEAKIKELEKKIKDLNDKIKVMQDESNEAEKEGKEKAKALRNERQGDIQKNLKEANKISATIRMLKENLNAKVDEIKKNIAGANEEINKIKNAKIKKEEEQQKLNALKEIIKNAVHDDKKDRHINQTVISIIKRIGAASNLGNALTNYIDDFDNITALPDKKIWEMLVDCDKIEALLEIENVDGFNAVIQQFIEDNQNKDVATKKHLVQMLKEHVLQKRPELKP